MALRFSSDRPCPKAFQVGNQKELDGCAALSKDKWMKGLQHITSSEEIESFVALWNKLQQVQLIQVPDSISWHWAASGSYSAKSAYNCQHIGTINKPYLNAIWKLKMEGKVCFFTWLLIQNRLPTADRLRDRSSQHDDKCSLCDQIIESAAHLFCQCPFAAEVWYKLGTLIPATLHVTISSFHSIDKWWQHLAEGPKQTAVTGAYFAWHIWKERNMRIFTNTASSPASVVDGLINDLQLIRLNVGEP
ncbi:uncharacterized protein [Aegilops tauschii subsp. strangulata]|uniref:uncharacterized protein n=1 Tax=Aegilops tauschii subsp. strangulata TaxID=200361 RepID=UPI003CC8CC15